MLHFLVLHWIAICVIGIVVNFWAYFDMCSDQPEGAMGTMIVIPFCFVPFLVAIPALLSKLGIIPK